MQSPGDFSESKSIHLTHSEGSSAGRLERGSHLFFVISSYDALAASFFSIRNILIRMTGKAPRLSNGNRLNVDITVHAATRMEANTRNPANGKKFVPRMKSRCCQNACTRMPHQTTLSPSQQGLLTYQRKKIAVKKAAARNRGKERFVPGDAVPKV